MTVLIKKNNDQQSHFFEIETGLQKELSDLKKENQNQKSQFTNIETDLRRKIIEIKKENQNQQSQYTKLETDLLNKINDMKKENQNQQSTHEHKMNREMTDLINKNNNQQSQFIFNIETDFQKEISDLKKENKDYQSRVNEMGTKLGTAEEKIISAESRLSSVGRSGSWCGYRDHWNHGYKVISYSKILHAHANSNMNRNALNRGTGKILINMNMPELGLQLIGTILAKNILMLFKRILFFWHI